jgi:hypothetical protein
MNRVPEQRRLTALVIWCVSGFALSQSLSASLGIVDTVKKFDGAPFEPSGVVQLAAGLVLAIGDESEYPLDFIDFARNDDPVVTRLRLSVKLNDLEGLTTDSAGYIYAITSHSVNRDGERKSHREKLARFKIVDDRIDEIRVIKDLKQHIPLSADLHESFTKKVKVDTTRVDGFNIEGLAWYKTSGSLLIGLRSPLDSSNNANVLSLSNPDAAFAGSSPEIRKMATVDLQGNGIRSMEYDELFGGFLILAGPTGDRGEFALWLWKPGTEYLRKLVAPKFDRLLKPEGICRIELSGRPHLLIVSDDGETDKAFYKKGSNGKESDDSCPGSYLILDYSGISVQ